MKNYEKILLRFSWQTFEYHFRQQPLIEYERVPPRVSHDKNEIL